MTTLVGILYFSVIMGFVVDGIRDKMDSLKKGKSRVAEDRHTVSSMTKLLKIFVARVSCSITL